MAQPPATKPATGADEEQGNSSQQEAFGRRQLFASGLVGFAATIAQACSSSDFAGLSGEAEKNSSNSDKKRKGRSKGGRDDGDDGDDGPGIVIGDDGGDDPDITDEADQCITPNLKNIDVDLPDATGELLPEVMMYGGEDNAMLAFQFPGSADIEHIAITNDKGRMIALHVVNGADKDDAGKFRPIVLDNLYLSQFEELRMVITAGDERVVHKVTRGFQNTFQGSPVRDLTSGAFNSPAFAHPRFSEGSGFDEDPNITYPNVVGRGARSLKTAKQSSSWTSLAILTGAGKTVTDVMGNPISMSDTKWILEYQTFIVYENVGGTYYRSFLKVG